ncbi:MAG: hypothetical protein MI922_15900, partial [Bacteroidales bacterium]|nr:hypothetical protein [Bacteroidales bacterium]
MRKIAILISLGIMIAAPFAQAQFKFGVRGGIQENVRMRDFRTDDQKVEYKTGTVGFHFGLTSELQVYKLFVQPELL